MSLVSRCNRKVCDKGCTPIWGDKNIKMFVFLLGSNMIRQLVLTRYKYLADIDALVPRYNNRIES